MTDIVEKLRREVSRSVGYCVSYMTNETSSELMEQAAAEVERLRGERDEAREQADLLHGQLMGDDL